MFSDKEIERNRKGLHNLMDKMLKDTRSEEKQSRDQFLAQRIIESINKHKDKLIANEYYEVAGIQTSHKGVSFKPKNSDFTILFYEAHFLGLTTSCKSFCIQIIEKSPFGLDGVCRGIKRQKIFGDLPQEQQDMIKAIIEWWNTKKHYKDMHADEIFVCEVLQAIEKGGE